MDLATLIGLIGAFGIVLASIMMGGSAATFVNAPSLLVRPWRNGVGHNDEVQPGKNPGRRVHCGEGVFVQATGAR